MKVQQETKTYSIHPHMAQCVRYKKLEMKEIKCFIYCFFSDEYNNYKKNSRHVLYSETTFSRSPAPTPPKWFLVIDS